MSDFPRNELERRLVQASTGGLSVEEWVAELGRAKVWVPVNQAAGAAGGFPVLVVDEASYVPAYTSQEELQSASQSAYFEVPTLALLDQLPDSVGLAINPGGLGLPISHASLRQALGGATTLTAGTSVRIGEPAEDLTDVLQGLAAAFGSEPAVREARRCWAHVGTGRPGLVLGLDVDPDNPQTRERALAAVRGGVPNAVGYAVDVVFTNDRDAFVEWMASNAQPFFRAG